MVCLSCECKRPGPMLVLILFLHQRGESIEISKLEAKHWYKYNYNHIL